MPRIIELIFGGEESAFEITKVERKKLYGCKKQIHIDSQGRECAAARLTEDGRHVLPHGSTASLYVDKSGDVVDRHDMMATDKNGNPIETSSSDIGGAQLLEGPISLDHFLEHTVTAVYQLDATALSSELESALARGEIFQTTLRWRTDSQRRNAFLLMGGDGVVLLSAEPGDYDYIGYTEIAADLVDETDDEVYDDFDFSVF